MNRPVWLFSMDTEQFSSPPITTGGLKSSFLAYGRSAQDTEVTLIHCPRREAIPEWIARVWNGSECARARKALASDLVPVIGLSCYTWNVAEFLELVTALRESCPELL